MPELSLSVIAPVTNDETARLASPAAFADLATRIVATEAPAVPPHAARKRVFLPLLGTRTRVAAWRCSRRSLSRSPPRGTAGHRAQPRWGSG